MKCRCLCFFLFSVLFSAASCAEQLPTGTWYAPAVGKIVQIDEQQQVHLFRQLTTPSFDECMLLESAALTDIELRRFTIKDGYLIVKNVAGLMPLVYQPLTSGLPSVCEQAQMPPYNRSSARNFDYLWSLFKQYYAFFELRQVNWDSLYQLYRSKVTDETNEAELFDIFSELLSHIDDGHVALATGFDSDAKTFWSGNFHQSFLDVIKPQCGKLCQHSEGIDLYLEQRSNAAINLLMEKYLENPKLLANNKILIGTLKHDPRIVYLNLMSMYEFAADDANIDEDWQALQQAMQTVIDIIQRAEATAIIIDVRFNLGGTDAFSAYIANHFHSQATLVFNKRRHYQVDQQTENWPVYSEPREQLEPIQDIILLTSPMTASAAEIFVLYMKAIENIVMIGQPTFGIFSDAHVDFLPNGWFVSLSNEVYTAADGHVYEYRGIEPTHVTEFFSENETVNLYDSSLERAIVLLQSHSTTDKD